LPDTQSGRSLVALTGATGFIGQHLQKALLDAGIAVRALIRQSSASTNLHSDCDVVRVDLGQPTSVAKSLENVDAVIYAAGSVRGRSPKDFQAANVDGVQTVAAALSKLPTNVPVLLLSSLAASAPELSFYAASKAAGERVLKENKPGQWSIIRPPAVYGPGDQEMRPIFNAIRHGLIPLIAPPAQRLPFIEVSDLISAMLAWLRNPEACSETTFTVDDGTANGYDWHDIQALIAPARALRIPVPGMLLELLGHVNLSVSRIAGYLPMLTPGKVRELRYLNWSCDNTAFTTATGWHPQWGLAEGVDRLFAPNLLPEKAHHQRKSD
jgi:nucleoside-diphosphate-sugar epimerase